MKVVATIEARMTSSRLPGKVLKPILGRPMLELLIERLHRVKALNEVVAATTVNATDDPIEACARRVGAGCFRGSEEDVLDRVLRAAQSVEADVIVEITGDCPLIDPDVIDRLIGVYLTNQYDYVSNVLVRTFPRGLDTQVFATRVLAEVAALTQDPANHEHVSLYIYTHPERFRLHNVASDLPPEAREMRLTVDTPEDYHLISHIYEELYQKNPAFDVYDVVKLLLKRPELHAINRNVQQKHVR